MKYWLKSIKNLKNAEKTLHTIYDSMCSYSTNTFFEHLENDVIITTTYGEFSQQVEKIAAILSSKIGAPRNSFVGIEMDNCPEWVTSFWALLMAGYRPLLLSTRLHDDVLNRIIQNAGAVAVITNTPSRKIDIGFNVLAETAHTYAQSSTKTKNFQPDWEDMFALTTSGTTGIPRTYAYKGDAVCKHILFSEHILTNNPTITYNSEGDIKILAFLPFCHIFGLITTLMWFSFVGRPFVFLKDYNPQTIRYTSRRHGITHFFAVPAVWNGIALHVRREATAKGQEKKLERALNFSITCQKLFPNLGRKFVSRFVFKKIQEEIFGNTVIFSINGGGYVREDTLKVLNGLGYPLYNGYGMSEVGISSVEMSMNIKQRIKGSVGKPFPGVDYRISDNGELQISGDTMHYAELKNGELYLRDYDYFNSGDAVIKDEKGYYYIQGRANEIIIANNGDRILADTIEKKFEIPHAESYCLFGVHKEEHFEIILIINPKKEISPEQHVEMLQAINNTNQTLPLAEKLTKAYLTPVELAPMPGTKVRRNFVNNLYLKNKIELSAIQLS